MKQAKNQQPIGKKIFLSVSGTAMGLGTALAALFLIGLLIMRNEITASGARISEALLEDTRTRLEHMTSQVAEELSRIYAGQINRNFEKIRENAQSVANYMEALYRGTPVLEELDHQVGYMGNARPEDIRQEFSKVKDIREYIRSVSDYDPEQLDALDLYVATESGMVLDGTGQELDGQPYQDLRESPWYLGAKEAGGVYWAEVFTGAQTGKEKITCGVPFYGEEGNLLGVVGADVSISTISQSALSIREGQVEHLILLNQKGEVMADPDAYGLPKLPDQNEIFYQAPNLISVYEVEETGWRLCLVFTQETVTETCGLVETGIQGQTSQILGIVGKAFGRLFLVSAAAVLIGFLSVVLISRRTTKSIAGPVENLMRQIRAVGSGELELEIRADGWKEISQLADSFNRMLSRLRGFMEEAAQNAARQERIGVQFQVAENIQKGMIPVRYPPFPERGELDIYGRLCGKEKIQGTFFDYFFVDEKYFCLFAGDVHQEGLPASLLMMVTRTMLRDFTNLGYQPEQVLREVNRQLGVYRTSRVNLTVFLGILNVETGVLSYANAGQTRPWVRVFGSEFRKLDCAKGFPLGSGEGLAFPQENVRLCQGDSLLLYGEGLMKLRNLRGDFFSFEELGKGLGQLTGKCRNMQEMEQGLELLAKEFTGSQELPGSQFFLTLRYMG